MQGLYTPIVQGMFLIQTVPFNHAVHWLQTHTFIYYRTQQQPKMHSHKQTVGSFAE